MGENKNGMWHNEERGDEMNITEIITSVDELRPNGYDVDQKIRWLSEIEGMIVDEILNMAEGNDIVFDGYHYEYDAEKETMLPDRFTDIYIHYLKAKIEMNDDELTQYNKEVAVYQSAYNQFASWYRRNHMPKQPAKIII